MVNQRRIRHSARVMHFLYPTLLVVNHIRYVGHSGNDVHVKLAVETFLHDFHMEQPKEAAAETESQSQRRLRLESQRGIVQLQFFQRSTQVLIILGLYRINSRKDHRLHFFESFDCLVARTGNVRNGISHLHFLRGLDARNNISYVTRTQLVTRNHIHLQYSDFIGIVFLTGIEELHLVSFPNDSVYYLEISNDSTEGVEYRVENQRLQWSRLIPNGMRNALYYRLQNIFHTHAGLSRSTDNVFPLAAQQIDDFILHFFGHCTGHITFVHDRNDFQIVFQCHIKVGYGLSLYSLRRIHHQQCAFAGRNGAGYFIRKVHVPRSVNQVQDVFFSLIIIFHLDGMALNRNTALTFQIHIIKHLSFGHFHRLSILQQTVRQSRLTMVDMGYNTEISDIFHSKIYVILILNSFKESLWDHVNAYNTLRTSHMSPNLMQR